MKEYIQAGKALICQGLANTQYAGVEARLSIRYQEGRRVNMNYAISPSMDVRRRGYPSRVV